MPSSRLTVDEPDQAYRVSAYRPSTFGLVARERFSGGRSHLLAPYQTRWVPVPPLLFSVTAFTKQSLTCYGK